MIFHVGKGLPSSLDDFSKRIASATTAITDQLKLGMETKLFGTGENQNNPSSVVEAPTIDPDVVHSYRTLSVPSRPSSRLLKERMFGHGNGGPRSAALLIPGSPAFTRPWRVHEGGSRRVGINSAVERHKNVSNTDPKSSAVSRQDNIVAFGDRRSSLKGVRRGRSSKPKTAWQERQPTWFGREKQRKMPRLSQTAAVCSANDAPDAGSGKTSRKARLSTVRKATTMAPSVAPSSTRLLRDATAAATDAGHSGESGMQENIPASSPGEDTTNVLFDRPSTAASIVPLEQRRVCLDTTRAAAKGGDGTPTRESERGWTEDTTCGTIQPAVDGNADNRKLSSGKASRSNEGLNLNSAPGQGRSGSEEFQLHANTALSLTSHSTASLPATGPDSWANQRPATAEAARRSTVESDAALSRSCQLPQATPSFSGYYAGSRVGGGGFSIVGGGVDPYGRNSKAWETRRRSQRTQGSHAVLIQGGNEAVNNTRRVSTRSKAPADSREARGKERRKSPMKRRRQQRTGTQKQSASSSSSPLADSPIDSTTRGSTGTTITAWWRPGDFGELEAQADPVFGRRSGKAMQRRNGAAAGAVWGGDDQMDRIAAAPKVLTSFDPERGAHATDAHFGLQRPDTREAFYAVPAETLAGLHPCVRCFDALMRHLRDGTKGDVLGRETFCNSAEAAADPHVSFFVRWESLEKDLGRYIPRGFIGSFMPRPFRPALAEYAVKAASEDPKFWGLGWAHIPDTRCRVVVINNLEVAQNERDWLTNRHGLLLSFKDGAGRHYQSSIFPETIRKAGWRKGQAIDALFRKAGYLKPRGRCPSHVPEPPESLSGGDTPAVGASTTGTAAAVGADPAVSRSVRFVRFQTVSFRMDFRKYQRATKGREVTLP